MCSEEVGLAAPTEALASFEPFVQWLLSASLQDLASIPDKIFLGFQVTSEEDGSKDVDKLNIEKQKRPLFESTCSARLALAEAEGSSEAAWDKLSCTLREWSTLGEKLLALREERDENSKYIELLERRIIKLLQDRDLAIAETYTIEKQIEDAEYFKVRQKRRQQLQEEELRKARVTSTLRKLLLRQGSGDSNITASPTISPATLKFTEQDVQRLHKELADTKVSAAVAKAEQDERRYAVRRAERQCIELKLALAQARAEEDDLQVSLQQLTRARRNSVDNLQQISLFSSTSLPLHPPPAPTAANRARAFSLLMYTG